MPFIGSAYSRAREYTADRYGAAISADPASGVRGLTILAAGPLHAKRVNLEAMMRQRHDMNTVWMTLGSWLSTHPPIVHRIAVLDRGLGSRETISAGPAVAGALAVIVLALMLPAAGGSFALFKFVKKMEEVTRQAQQTASASAVPAPRRPEVTDVPAATAKAQREMAQLAEIAKAHRAKTGAYPADEDALYSLWQAEHPGEPEPVDPFDGQRYGYGLDGDGYEIYSAGDRRDDVTARLHISSANR